MRIGAPGVELCGVRPLRLLLPLALIALAAPASALAAKNSSSGGTSYPTNGGTTVANGGATALPGSTAPSGQSETGSPPGARSPGQEQQGPGESNGGATPGSGTGTDTTGTGTTTGAVTNAVLLANGKARAPKDAPAAVKKAIRAGNRLQGKPYVFGGGHGRWDDTGYDCSGAVSYALRGGGLLTSPLDSSLLMAWGQPGAGQWITVYANPNHTFVIIAGLRMDTGGSDVRGPRWRAEPRATGAFTARHPTGL
jgi:cell wall-associated NlpC family hydrolase